VYNNEATFKPSIGIYACHSTCYQPTFMLQRLPRKQKFITRTRDKTKRTTGDSRGERNVDENASYTSIAKAE